MRRKWLVRVVAGFFCLIGVTTIGLGIAYSVWLSDHLKHLQSGSRVASTPRGDIKYAIAGVGTPLLIIHGSPGGYDHSIVGPLARPEEFDGFKIIAVSRPGYLRTPLSSGKTPADQADLYAALLGQNATDKRVTVQPVRTLVRNSYVDLAPVH